MALIEAHVADLPQCLGAIEHFLRRAVRSERGEITHRLVADGVEHFEFADRLELAAQSAQHEPDELLALLPPDLRFLARDHCGNGKTDRNYRNAERASRDGCPHARPPLRVAALQ